MMSKKVVFSSKLLVIGVFSLLAVGSWVGFEIYKNLTQTTVPKVLQEQIKPLETEIDDGVVIDLQNRRVFNEQLLNSVKSRALETKKQDNEVAELELLEDSGSSESVEVSASAQVD